MNNQHTPGLGFARKTMLTFVTLAFTQVIFLVIGIITARILGPGGKGVFTLVNLYPMVLLTLLNLSIYRAVTVHAAEGKFQFSHFPATLIVYGFISSAVMIGIFAAIYYFQPRYFTYEAPSWLIFSSLTMIPFVFIIGAFSSLLEVKNKISQLNIKNIVNSLVLLAAIIIGLSIIRAGVAGAVLAYVLAYIVTAVVVIWMARRINRAAWVFDTGLLKILIRDGAKLHIAVIANFILLRIDMLILGYLKPSASVGYYSTAVSISELLFVLMTAIQTGFYSNISDMLKNKKDMIAKTMAVYRHSLFLFVIGAIGLAISARWLIILFYGPIFLPALRPLLILLPGAAMLYLNNTLVNYLVSHKKFIMISSVCTVAAIINVILNVMWIPCWDSNGAALASALTYALNAIIILILFCRAIKISVRQFVTQTIITKDDIQLYYLIFQKACYAMRCVAVRKKQ